MELKKVNIQMYFCDTDYSRGRKYCADGRVRNLSLQRDGETVTGKCIVVGTERYSVHFTWKPASLEGYCSCPRFSQTRHCKHLAAALLEAARSLENPSTAEVSDRAARQILNRYLALSQPAPYEDLHGQVRLNPRIQAGIAGSYPLFSFQVGISKMYIIRDIQTFLQSVEQGKEVSYGKGLTFTHTLSQFDTRSQALIAALREQFRAFQTMERGFSASGYASGANRGAVEFIGSAFDRWFDLLRDMPLDLYDSRKSLLLREADPEVRVRLSGGETAAQMAIELPDDLVFFGNPRTLYALSDTELLRCSPTFLERVYPMLSGGVEQLRFSVDDLPAFCSCVLPQISELVELDDPDGLLQRYLPDECAPCYYLDLTEYGALSVRLLFQYGDRQLESADPRAATPDVKRDALAEAAALRPLQRDFIRDERGKRFLLRDEDAVYSFLAGQLDTLRRLGEVFLSDRLKGRRISAETATVGVSVSGGLLSLDIDTGEFPPEELEALYQSLLARRSYHRLADGRYLELNGSAYETLAELAHMAQLPARTLKSGHVTLPAYRGLYLDGVLSSSENIFVRRDAQFRAMVRNFKSVSDSDYAVPAGLEGVLRPYQKIGFQWLKTLESCGFGGILADEMGLGKTVQVIAFLATAPRQSTGLSNLIVCPTSLVLNWADEFQKFAPTLRVELLAGTAAARNALFETAEPDVWVTSYDLLKRDLELYEGREFYCCVLDEGQNIKNQSTLASKSVKRLACRQRFVLTGTPIENRLSELWNLFDFLMPGYLFSHTAFVERLEKPVVQSGDEEAGRRLGKLVQPFLLRRLKRDVLKELPPKIEHVQKIPLSEAERKAYLASAAAAKKEFSDSPQGKLQVLAALTRLRQLCCDPNLCFENYDGPTSKLEACLELCAGMVENGHQILLFSQFTSMLERIRRGLDALKISSFTLQGSTPREKRAELVKRFNAGGASVFLISLKAGGTGLNLTAADVVIHYDPWWNLAAQEQATDRAHRIGQQAHVQVYKLIARDTIEEKILDLQAKKAALMDAVSAASEQGILAMSQDELLALLD